MGQGRRSDADRQRRQRDVSLHAPSLSSRVQSKALDKRHASKMFQRALLDPDWQAISFTSHDNPHLSQSGLARAAKDMTQLAYRMEILAEDVDDNPKVSVDPREYQAQISAPG